MLQIMRLFSTVSKAVANFDKAMPSLWNNSGHEFSSPARSFPQPFNSKQMLATREQRLCHVI
jgi:hypothetical protein